MLSQRSRDWLLISALHKLYVARSEKTKEVLRRIESWQCCFSIGFIMLICALHLVGEKTSHEAVTLMLAAFVLPKIFGFWLSEHVRHMNRIPESEEIAAVAVGILGGILEIGIENTAYISLFEGLLTAIVDEDPFLSVALANDLDAYGDHAIQLTRFVRAVYVV